MKKIMLLTFMLLSAVVIKVNAEEAPTFASISAFAGTTNGIILSLGTDIISLDIPIDDGETSGSAYVKTSFNVNAKYKVWIGAGQYSPKSDITDTTEDWSNTSINVVKSMPSYFVEVEHSSGVFLRITHFDGEASALFKEYSDYYYVDKNCDDTMTRDLLNSTTVSKSYDENLIWLGYKYKW